MLSKEEIEKAKETMKHWVEYEKQNKEKINKADELIKIQETLLQYIEQLEQENNKQNKMIDEMAEELVGLTVLDIEKDKFIDLEDKEEAKQYFEKKVEEK